MVNNIMSVSPKF